MELPVDISLSSEALRLYLTEVKNTSQEGEEEEEEEPLVLNKVEQATDFLNKVGLTDLFKIYREGKEITDPIINDSIRRRNLTPKQAHTVRSRIRTLNKVVRSREPRRKQRQDIRDVAWNAETSSTGTRSRSATPNSLDFVEPIEEDSTSDDDHRLPLQPYSLDSPAMNFKLKLSFTNSEPSYTKFYRTDRCDIANLDSSKVVLKKYHVLNEPGIFTKRERSDSDPTADSLNSIETESSELFLNNTMSRSHSSLLSDEAVSFEGLVKQINTDEEKKESDFNSVCIEDLTDVQYLHLKPLLWMEITAIFDQYDISIVKRKSCSKNKRGNVFGVNPSSLLMRDGASPTDKCMVPQIFQRVLYHLNTRCLEEDGLLRVGSQQLKLNTLCAEIEEKFFSEPEYVEALLTEASPHELTGTLKKLLRDLPDTIFTMELVDMFYKCSKIPPLDQIKALNLLVLLLPVEYRNTLRLLLNFFLNVISQEKHNRMNLHNVAMIAAPSFFSPRLFMPKVSKLRKASKTPQKDELEKQINGAAVSCCITELILKNVQALWKVPNDLVQQAKDAQLKAEERKNGVKAKRKYGKKKLFRSRTQYEATTKASPRVKKSDLCL